MTSKCIDVYKNLSIQVVNDSVCIAPCCVYQQDIQTTSDIINFIDDDTLSAVRKHWDSGNIPQGCLICKHEESIGNSSRRIGSNHWYRDNGYDNTDIELVRLDYWVGDVCNLRCVICKPSFSSAWKEELKIPIVERRQTVNHAWKDLDLSKLRYIHFNGGEPLLSKEHMEFLKAIPDKSQVHIVYDTNGTILPSEKLQDLWTEFKLVHLGFSIDDLNERFEYQRYPAKWNNTVENLHWFIDNCSANCMFSINTTISWLNQSNMINIDRWVNENFNTSRVNDPIKHQKLSAVGIFAIDNIDSVSIINFLNSCDQRRGTDWRKIFPELADKLL